MSSRQSRSNVSYRPLWWLCGTGFALFVIGMFIVRLSLSSSATESWVRVGVFVAMLCGVPIFIIPGTLLAVQHPWGATFSLLTEHYAHPRLFGLALAWSGLVLSGGTGVLLFALDPLSAPRYLPLAELPVGLAPLLALALFDRRR